MTSRSLGHFLGDRISLLGLKHMRRRADRRGVLRRPFAVPVNDVIGQRLIATGSFELTQIDALARLIADPMALLGVAPDFNGAFVDVGANIGIYAVHFADRFPRVLAVEPNPATFHILQANIMMSRFTNVVACQAACSDHAGVATLHVPTSGTLGWSTLRAKSRWDAYPVEVPLTTLDDLVAAEISERVAMIKIDVEGFEHDVLRGAVRTLEADGPVVLYETLSASSAQACAAVLRQAGYGSFYKIERDRALSGLFRGLPVAASKIDPDAVQKEALIFAVRESNPR